MLLQFARYPVDGIMRGLLVGDKHVVQFMRAFCDMAVGADRGRGGVCAKRRRWREAKSDASGINPARNLPSAAGVLLRGRGVLYCIVVRRVVIFLPLILETEVSEFLTLPYPTQMDGRNSYDSCPQYPGLPKPFYAPPACSHLCH